ncbi:MAG: DUF4783 domain-containing protein [Ignavibacteriota bacterium]|jgi:hypothetical protein|nr:MAG: DUF4783 domain-containing protein [Chlorobiota bacterium]MBE7477329.1 DUF4783 domain-containing protein [Ignavibacteriales bacterium]MBL1122729.1 DUF4783 domain-containing protein [Ignavibacteriota bacterium]MBV6419182.1 hypothetical protein [Ignavibacteriaceae bacterium]MCE7856227.1 DUF4783 domain-containing protein [Ignavibacteria bacterium CHB3]MEB2295550.1 DUF4783 domain-containing protein [Ignavibacteria bacterium]
MKTLFFNILTSIVLLTFNYSAAQDEIFKQNLSTGDKIKIQSKIFSEIESGILNSDVKKFSQYFSPQPYISLINGVNGYYSSNQAFYILEKFFNEYRVVSFKLEESKTEGTVSFGKGDYQYEKKGRRESAHLYITLNKSGSRWYITQLSIN